MSEYADRIEELVSFLVSSLVDDPDQVSVLADEQENHLRITLQVSDDDIGKIIGRGGRTIKSIRTLARAAAGDSPLLVEVDVGD